MYDFGGVALDCSKCCKMAVSLLNTSRACKNMFLMSIVRYDALKYEFLRILIFFSTTESHLAQEIFKDKIVVIVRRR